MRGTETVPPKVAGDLKSFLDNSSYNEPKVLEHSTIDWFRAHHQLSMTRPRELYRGLFFTKDGNEHLGKTFLNARSEGQMVPFAQKGCSSWTSVLGVARRFALNSRELVFPKMRQEFLRANKPSDEPIGVVVCALITPEQVVCDVAKVAKHCGILGSYGQEWEYILKPLPSMQVRIINIYTYDLLNKAYANSVLWGPAKQELYAAAPEYED